jgi:hypothetical protein
MSIVNVRHINKNTVRVEPAAGYNVIVFLLGDSPEIIVSSVDGDDTVRVGLVPAGPDQKIRLRACDNRVLEIIYQGPSQ